MKLGERALVSSVIVSFLFVLTVLIYCFTSTKTEKTKIQTNTRVYELIDLEGTSSFDVPLPEPINGNMPYAVTYKLPNISKSNACIMYKSLYTASRVYVDGEFVASYGTKEQLPYGKMIGNIRVIVPMKAEYSGKELTIIFSPIYQLGVETPTVNLGTSDDLKMIIIHENIWRIVLIVILSIVTITCFGLCLYQFVTNTIHISIASYLYLGWFVFAVMTWILCSSDIPQFYTNANGAVSLFSYLSLAVMGIPYVGFCGETFIYHKKILQAVETVGCCVPFTTIILFIAGIMDPPESVFICHIYIFMIMVCTIIISILEWKKNKDARLFILGVFALSVSAIVGFVFYFVRPELGFDALSFGIGFFLFILDLLVIMLLRESRFVKERLSMNIYKEMAFIDKLTGCGNRAALENEIKEGHFYGDKPIVTFGIFDLNNLKITNDTFGHAEGDKLIMAAANCLTNSFGATGKTFRLGGDEFAIVLWNEPGKYNSYIDKLDEEMAYYNQSHEAKVSMAKGVVEREWKEGDKFFYKLYHDADEIMYEDKERYHELKKKQTNI